MVACDPKRTSDISEVVLLASCPECNKKLSFWTRLILSPSKKSGVACENCGLLMASSILSEIAFVTVTVVAMFLLVWLLPQNVFDGWAITLVVVALASLLRSAVIRPIPFKYRTGRCLKCNRPDAPFDSLLAGHCLICTGHHKDESVK